jgi:hypothetical protein
MTNKITKGNTKMVYAYNISGLSFKGNVLFKKQVIEK